MEPNVLIKSTVERYANGLKKKLRFRRNAAMLLNNYNITRNWDI
jgi:hypothetical protein